VLFASVAAVCVTVRRGGGPLPTAFRLATRGLRWSRPGILTGRLELDVPRRLRGRGAQMARLGESSSVTPQVPLLTDGESQNFAGGAGIYQPDWDEIDLGDDFLPGRGEFDRAKNRGDGDARRNRNTNPHRNIPGLGAYEDDGSVPWMRRMMPGFDENFAGTDSDDDVAAVGEKKSVENKKPVDADSFARAFPNGAPRLRPSVLSEKTPERGWEDSSDDTAYTESPYETAFENGGGHFQQGGKTGAAYEDDLGVGELEESYAASAQVSERQQRFMVSKERQQENELARWRALRGTKNADPKRAKAKSDAALGAATAGGALTAVAICVAGWEALMETPETRGVITRLCRTTRQRTGCRWITATRTTTGTTHGDATTAKTRNPCIATWGCKHKQVNPGTQTWAWASPGWLRTSRTPGTGYPVWGRPRARRVPPGFCSA